MGPKQYLTGFTPSVRVSGETYIVDYGVGECVYTRYTSRSADTYSRTGKRIKQEVLQLIKCDMWKVITLIDGKSPLNEGDYQDLNMEIRDHSLNEVTNFINERGPHQ
jgi:hypothetical protein